MSSLSRRQFLQLTALTAGALAGGPLLTACGQPPTSTPTSAPAATPIPDATNTAPAPTLPAPAPNALVTIIFDGGGSQFEVISPQGVRVLIDVATPSLLQSKDFTENDVLLITHSHDDHFNRAFAGSFPGKKLVVETGDITLGDVVIHGIAAGHNVNDQPKPKDGTDYIFLLEINGLRIAHFGDIGQDALTEEQMAALGQVDVAMTQFANSYSDMNINNKKGFNLMEQVKPALILPTHADAATIKYAFEIWQGFCTEANNIQIDRAGLPEKTSIVLTGKFTMPMYLEFCEGKQTW